MSVTPDPNLEMIQLLLCSYVPPKGALEQSDNYFSHYVLLGNPIKNNYFYNGSFQIAKVTKQNKITVSIHSMRKASSQMFFNIDCNFTFGNFLSSSQSNSSLNFPTLWSSKSGLCKNDGTSFMPETILQKSVRLDGDQMTIETKGDIQKANVGNLCIPKWCLFEVIKNFQRLPKTEKLSFVLVDEVDEIHTDQTVSFYRKVKIVPSEIAIKLKELGIDQKTLPNKISKESYELFGYLHTGKGVIPTVYWLDKTGRVIFVISGIEIFALLEGDISQWGFDYLKVPASKVGQ